MGRKWISDHAMNILMSLILKPKVNIESVQIITFATANILISAIQKYLFENNIYNLKLDMKWPNDIFINNKKIAGVLTESCILNKKIKYIIVGMGVNVNQNMNEFSDKIKKNATSLYKETGKKFPREKIIIKILEEYEKSYLELMKNSQVS